uniref:SH3 domain and tetratricopeptide repeats 1 n=1 Tax=Esox lucius TaxID=8010 RepID=A0A6Q2Y4R0_ESOLU
MSNAEQEFEPVSLAVGNGIETNRRCCGKELSAEDHKYHYHDHVKFGTITKSRRMEKSLSREASSVKGTMLMSENGFPTALPMLLAMVEGPDRLPADEGSQEVLRGKLRLLEVDSIEVNALFTELSARLVSVNSEENIILVTFKTFEEIWKFTTYYTMGFLGLCMENLLLDQDFWLSSLDQEDVGIEISIQEETLNLMYKGILMQEVQDFLNYVVFFIISDSAICRIILDFPRHISVHCSRLTCLFPIKVEGLRELLINLKNGIPSSPLPILPMLAIGSCEATVEYDAGGPDELSLLQGDRVGIVGLLVSCFEWFTGRLERTGEVGLVMTTLVKPADDTLYLLDCITQWASLHHPSSRGRHHHQARSTCSSPLLPQCSDYKPEFGTLYRQTPKLLLDTFNGHLGDVDQLVAYLGVARETARKKRLHWSQSRLCFLLGKLCAGRSKFSQARVYFEEALSIPRDGFTDMLMLASIYANLAVIYLKQKNTEKYFALSERIAALLMGIPDCVSIIEKDSEVLKFILKKAVLSHNKMAEARSCFLLANLHWRQGEEADTVPFLERLLFLSEEPPGVRSVTHSHGYLSLGRLYSQLSLPHLCVSSARRAMTHPSARLIDCLNGMGLVLQNTARLYGVNKQEVAIPALMAPYLSRSLQTLALCLSQLFQKHGMLGHAVHSMHTVIEHYSGPSSSLSASSSSERKCALVWLAWLHICNSQPEVSLDILDSVLASMPDHCITQQEGLVHNMRGVALRCKGDLRRAAESYQAAIDVCEEFEDRANWAVAEANLSLLCLKAGAKRLGERHLTEAVRLFSELEEEGHEENFITVLLEMGQHCVNQGLLNRGKIYYEWALLMAIKSNHSDSQLSATQRLAHLYGAVCPDHAQCIIYYEHQLTLLTNQGDRQKEGEVLETISQLYLSLGTERAWRLALDYTKRSLGIFIDLGRREKEAYAWLYAGKIYHMLGQTELVDLYVQVAQDVSLSTGDTHFILHLLEAAGDVFFNSCQEREKAICFYRDRALPIAVRTSSLEARLRLSNKLVELLLNLKMFGEAVEYAQTSLDISITLGDRLNERVAFHRLAYLYHCLGQFELAEHYYLKTLSLCPAPLQFDEETLYYVRVYKTLGDIIFYDLKDPYDAAGYYHLALAAAMDLGNKKSQLQLCTRLATIYHNFLVDRELSLFFYQKARVFASDLNIRRINLSPSQNFHSMPHAKENL